MEVRPGYKQTEAGVIPEEWKASTVGREFDIKLGKMLDAQRNVGLPKPYLGNKAVQWDRIDVSDLSTVPMSSVDIDRFRLRKGDLLVCEGGEVGRAAIWDAPIEECYYQKALHRLRPLRGFDSRLMAAMLRHWSDGGMLANYVTQTSIAHLPRERFVEVPLPVPPCAEQHAIAEALSDVDALIGALDSSLAKKRDLREAAMQQLLTGQKRLPGFTGKWEVKRFADVAFLRRDTVDPKKTTVHEFCIELEHIESASGLLLGSTITGDQSSLKSVFRAGDVLFGKLRAYLKKFWLATRSGVCSTEIWVFVPNDRLIASTYLFQIVKTAPFIEVTSSAYGTHMPRSDWSVVKNYETQLPPLYEQAAIAEVLSDMDAELAVLRQRRDKTRALKQGMMQELLTGKTRLV
jgi:type I restriction enzyme, S subunit